MGFGGWAMASEVDFNREIRPILSNRCLVCHGPDAAERKAGLRLDTEDGARADLGGYAAIQPGNPEASELFLRVTAKDEADRMPPAKTGDRLTEDQISLLRRWIEEGAGYARHWAYVKPRRSSLPRVSQRGWARNPIDFFVLARLEERGWSPSPEADCWALARRAALDLTGLPPTLEEAEAFLSNKNPLAYERYVDALLHRPAYGERWAGVWLDLARYADSAGYADDPPRTIWGYRDYVVRSLNNNMPFDRFTVEQLAGDLLPNPSDSQLTATAFHRNTMTNNEGGTNDEQFRNEAIIDRVNTTMQVWMGTTMACAQCHDHKYDPISQKEYFEFFAFFNNTEDSDKRDERPLLPIYTEAQQRRAVQWSEEEARLKWQMERPNNLVKAEQRDWEKRMRQPPKWSSIRPYKATARHRSLNLGAEGLVQAEGEKPAQDVYQVRFRIEKETVEALRLETRSQPENFALSQAHAVFRPDESPPIKCRFVRIELPGKGKILSLAEVEVIRGGKNVALSGKASQSSTAYEGEPGKAIDGNRNGDYQAAKSTTHTAAEDDPWWELDLGKAGAVDEVLIWNRTDGGDPIGRRLAGFQLQLLSADRAVLWEEAPAETPSPSLSLTPGEARSLRFSDAVADYAQKGFAAEFVLNADTKKAWSVGGQTEKPHHLILALEKALEGESGELVLTLRQESESAANGAIDAFALSMTDSRHVAERFRLPEEIRQAISVELDKRTREQAAKLAAHYRTLSPTLRPYRERLAQLEKQRKALRPYTTIPIFRELPAEKSRQTHIQVRGNYRNKAEEVSPGTPSVFPPIAERMPKNRLALAQWLIDKENPLTARVIANRHWEQIFGVGLVATSEEFGSQGELPTHPELLDWLAVELVESGWDLKHLLRLIATSATYRQSAKATPAMLQADPENRFFARGPRIRLSAEMIRDQALFIGGLLSDEQFGPSVRPPQPKMGLSAAFGSRIDWETSQGADKYRRGLYTNWRRSNPYPSMITFDAPNREVCTVRRPRSNTPLQALVTLNDPVYIEAAQGLARRIASREGSPESKVDWAFRAALIRPPTETERNRLVALYRDSVREYEKNPAQAREMSVYPLGDPGDGADFVDLAAWTVVGNVILNLDEIFLKR